jgi:hypothetical protein
MCFRDVGEVQREQKRTRRRQDLQSSIMKMTTTCFMSETPEFADMTKAMTIDNSKIIDNLGPEFFTPLSPPTLSTSSSH